MSWKIIAALVVALLLIVGAGGWLDHSLSYSAGSRARDAQCAIDRAADKSSYEAAQTDAVTKAAKAQQRADADQLAELTKQLKTAQSQSLAAQHAADAANAKAATLNATLARLNHESKDVDAWSRTCLPAELLAGVHEGGTKAAPSSCR